MTENEIAEQTGIFSGKVHKLKRNQSVLFHKPDSVWYVESGVIELKNVRYEDGIPIGGRRHLFNILTDEVAFGHEPEAESGFQGWMGIMQVETILREVSIAEFVSKLIDGDMDCYAVITNWTQRISENMSIGNTPPQSLARIPEKGEYAFGKEETIAAPTNDFLLLRIQSGNLNLFGLEDFTIEREYGYIMAGSDLWFQCASEEVEIVVSDVSALRGPEEIVRGISALHSLFSRVRKRLEEEEEAEEIERRKQSTKLQMQESDAAINNLSSVLSPIERFPDRDTPLLTAAAVVASQIGAEVRPPMASENLARVNDPVEPIARASRLRYRKIIFTPEWWKYDGGPVIGFLGDERKPVALLPTGKGYDIVDPDKRVREHLTPEVRDEINGDAYMLYRPLPDRMRRMADLVPFVIKGKINDLFFIGLMALLTTLLGMLTPRITGSLVDTAIPSADRAFLYQLAAALFVAGIGAAVFMYIQVMTTVRTSLHMENTAQSTLWDRLLKFSPRFFRQYSSGDLQIRVNAVSEISRELSVAAIRPLFSGVMAMLNWLLLWYYSWDLAKIALWMGLAILLTVLLVGTIVKRLSVLLYDVEGQYHGLVIQLIGSVAKIRVSGSELRAFNHWLRKYTQQLKLVLKIQQWKDLMTTINNVLIPIGTAFIFWKAVEITIDLHIGHEDRISIGDFVAFNTAFALYLTGWTNLTNAVVDVLNTGSKIERIEPIVKAEPEVSEIASDPGRLSGHIAVENVSFRYVQDGPLIIDDISLEINPGEYVAFVGASGSGKSTILRLLLGFETPEYGRVLYDGQDLAGLDLLAVRRQIGTVLQEGRLNAASILNNISNNSRVTHAEVLEAIADAGMEGDVNRMPMGLHTMISEGGSNLSGGQRQRLLIARAMILRPKIVMFDEATSALDNKTQDIVSQSLDRRNVTRIVIAHRLSTIQQADRIYTIDKGRFVQQGTFQELGEKPGIFQDLMARQMA